MVFLSKSSNEARNADSRKADPGKLRNACTVNSVVIIVILIPHKDYYHKDEASNFQFAGLK